MLEVRAYKGESVDSILGKLRRKMIKAGLRFETKRRQYHQSPSELKNVAKSRQKFVKRKKKEQAHAEKIEDRIRKRRGRVKKKKSEKRKN